MRTSRHLSHANVDLVAQEGEHSVPILILYCAQNCIGALTDTSELVKSIYQGGYANFQGFSPLCLQGLEAQPLLNGFLQLYVCSSSFLYSRCRVCALCVPCKRCSCYLRECLLIVLTFSIKDAAKPNVETSFITQTAVQ